ncbi:hypothetical protein GDO81_008787, partial [Engystomops pustulosus]
VRIALEGDLSQSVSAAGRRRRRWRRRRKASPTTSSSNRHGHTPGSGAPQAPLQLCVGKMAVTLDTIKTMGFLIFKMVLRFAFMVVNNTVAIPSYVLYLIALQPLRLIDSRLFWYIEGVMFKWLLAMVASWGWTAGYT